MICAPQGWRNWIMKLYDSSRAPNPRRVRIFLAEKGIAVPLAPVDLMKLEHKSEAFTRLNPRQLVPALELDDGTVISETDRHLSLFRGAAAGAQPVRTYAPGTGHGGDVAAPGGAGAAAAGDERAAPTWTPAMAALEVPQVPAWGEANKPRISLSSNS